MCNGSEALLERTAFGAAIGEATSVDEGGLDSVAADGIESVRALLSWNCDERTLHARRQCLNRRQAGQASNLPMARIDREDLSRETHSTKVPDDPEADSVLSR
jgi:hypothetical protein